MKKILNFNNIIFFFFIFYFLIGNLVFDDYPVTPDEELHRINGFISLKYISNFFSINLDNLYNFENIPFLYNDWRKTYGAIFDIPFALYEVFYKPNIRDLYLIRHYTTFLIFFIATIYFFFLIYKNLQNKRLALLGTLILVTTPRIFSHSFYNSKDILFLSLIIIALYYSINLLRYNNFKSLLLSCIFCALATNIRVIGIYLPFLIFLFYFFLKKEIDIKSIFIFSLLYFFIYFGSLYIIWPFLWENPFQNFLSIIKESASYPNWWNFNTLYFGKYFSPENLPWHYFPVWFFLTTPFLFFLLIIGGLFIFLKKYLIYFLNISFKKNIFLWRSQNEMINLFIFLVFFIPVFLVITLNSSLYNGWRHLFFVYPSLIYFSIYGLASIKKILPINFYKILLFIVTIQIISNINFIIKSHPVQNVYFNLIAKPFIENKFPVDYWGLGNKKTIDYLLTQKNRFNISSSSFTPLKNLRYSKIGNTSYLDLINFRGTQMKLKNSSDYIFTNYFYNRNPKNLIKFQIPKHYKSYYKLIIDGIIVNEVFIK